MTYPCYECADRIIKCNANCERYLTAVAKNREIRIQMLIQLRRIAGKGKLNTLKR